MKYLMIVFLVASFTNPTIEEPVLSPIPPLVVEAPKPIVKKQVVHYTKSLPTPEIKAYIALSAQKYGVSEVVMNKVISCESNYKPNAVGDGGKSHGLVQIHQPSHPYITRAQATDPEFAIDFLARNLADGKGRMWTCWRMLS